MAKLMGNLSFSKFGAKELTESLFIRVLEGRICGLADDGLANFII
jgi:hypothetical protein